MKTVERDEPHLPSGVGAEDTPVFRGQRRGRGSVAALVAALTCASCHRAALRPSVRVYVSDEDSNEVTVIDPATDLVVASIPVGKRPRGLRVSPDGKTLFVALSGSPKGGPGIDDSTLASPDRAADGIGVVDLSTLKLVRMLRSGPDPESFDITPDGTQLFVSNEETAQLSIVDVASGSVVATLPVGAEPEGVTMRPGGREVYVASETGNTVAIIDVNLHTILTTITTIGRPRAIAFTPDGRRAFVSGENFGIVHVIDAVNRGPEGDIKLEKAPGSEIGPRPMGVRCSLDGKLLYVANGRAGTISIVDLATWRVLRTIVGVGARPWGLDLTPDGRRLYVANGPSNDVAVVDTVSGSVIKVLPVGRSPWGVSMWY